MVEDGYYPSMIVCTDCFDARHPQERLPRLSDPITIFKPAPDDVGDPPALSLQVIGLTARLTWTQAAPINARIDSYDVYRSVNGADFTLVVSLPITYDIFMAITAQTLTYDTPMSSGATYTYFVAANTDPPGPDVLTSNQVQTITPPNVVISPSAAALTISGLAPMVTNEAPEESSLFVGFEAGTSGAYVGTSVFFSVIGLSIGTINTLGADLITSTVACAVQSGNTFIVSFTRPSFPGTLPPANYFDRILVTDSLGGEHVFASVDAVTSTYNILGSPTGRSWTWSTPHPLFLDGLDYEVLFLGPITP